MNLTEILSVKYITFQHSHELKVPAALGVTAMLIHDPKAGASTMSQVLMVFTMSHAPM